jgi:4-hydroxythreonine-4-phosphate dehydrogenase
MAMPKRPIGISLGDPTGIGPEVVVRALAARPAIDARIFGDLGVLQRAAAVTGVAPPAAERVRAITALPASDVVPGRPTLACGRAQLAYLEAAVDAALAGEIGALVTAPISKDWIARAGFTHPGHTEYLAARAGVTEFAMMLAGPKLRVVLATTHVALREIPTTLDAETIARAIYLAAHALRHQLGIARPRIAVAGLNPHAGEAGRFGDEETRLVEPAIAAARARLAEEDKATDEATDKAAKGTAENAAIDAVITGPCVPDAVFRQAALGQFDAVVALYHDQGLIPVKLLHFDEAVNVTLGLPFARTSPDHGTAYDIAGRGLARADSFLAALDLAQSMAS